MQFGNIDYIDWYIKTCVDIEYDLALSSMPPFTQKDIGIFAEDLNFGEILYDGDPNLIENISKIYKVKKESVLITCGTTHANFLVCAGLLSEGDEVVVEHPIYTPILDLIGSFKPKVKFLEREFDDGYRIIPDKLNEIVTNKTKLIVITNLHNPSSVETEHDTLREITKIAEDAGSYVLSDEVYRDFILEDRPPVLSSISDRTLSTCSLSKFYGAGALRIGWITCAPELKEQLKKINLNLIITNMVAGEYYASKILENRDWFEERVKNVRGRNFPIIEEWVRGRVDVLWVPPTYGVMAFISLGKPIDSMALSERLLRNHNTMIAPGHFFGIEDAFRVGFSGDSDTLRAGLQNIGYVLDEIG